MHCILGKKCISWFESYLSRIIFKVNTDKKFLDLANVNCDFPQGSILGSLLFLHVNDIYKCKWHLQVNDMP